jgi:hypothetical protein
MYMVFIIVEINNFNYILWVMPGNFASIDPAPRPPARAAARTAPEAP